MTKPYKPKFKKSPFNHVKYTLVRNQEQLNQALKEMNGHYEMAFKWQGNAEVATVHVQGEWTYCYLQIGDTTDWLPEFIIGTLVHEAVHIWQIIRKRMNERKPSVEFEAYSVESIFRNVLDMYNRSQAK